MIRRLILQPITKTLMMRGKPDQIIFQKKKTFSKIQKKYIKMYFLIYFIYSQMLYISSSQITAYTYIDIYICYCNFIYFPT